MFSSDQMRCLRDNSLYIVYVMDLIMEHIYMYIPVGKWSVDL